ncbi:E3 ubiquitin-protein ligase IRC20 [Sugiyamaella lignohabitans]|uniref:E3 ubiquitin-protein ligase IRC20 n=1 Tax=Sugiyamaella lignohabitans TaxID=796027 RepID=A0A167EQX2_9ASCO|nr:E3 ubiquitin-protein ligase IRC20 [Sugiyamaella lignohabitans]ANB14363.1 E3 ubiquitin-protein ligase IRC20 [Sugiyamaella lignohabitans]
MDSDIYFSLDRPHVTFVATSVFRPLLRAVARGLTSEDNSVSSSPLAKRKKTSNKTQTKTDVKTEDRADLEASAPGEPIEINDRPGITLLKRSLNIGILLPFNDSSTNGTSSNEPISSDLNSDTTFDFSLLINGPFNGKIPVNVVKRDDDPTRFLVYVAENVFRDPQDEEDPSVNDKKRKRAKSRSKSEPKFVPPLLLELQITKDSKIISDELALLKQIATSSRSIKAHQIFRKITSPVLYLDVEKVDSKSMEITFRGSIDYSLVMEDSADALYAQTTHSPAMRLLFAYLLNNETYLEKNSRNLDAAVDAPLFYNIISARKDKAAVPATIEVDQLVSSLLRYQRETVMWCLRKEGKDLVFDGGHQKIIDLDPEVRDYVVSPPPGWSKLILPTPQDNDKDLWINPYLGCVCTEQTLRDTISKQMASSEHYSGKGLLAEEMGLGKTVEMIALLLLNQRKDIATEDIPAPGTVNGVIAESQEVNGIKQEPVESPEPVEPESVTTSTETQNEAAAESPIDGDEIENDEEKANPSAVITARDQNLLYDYFLGRTVLKAKTTLVITPASIRTQWVEELAKHAPSLSVCIYKGLKGGRKNGINEDVPTAAELSKYDVVITTYRTIATEMHFAFYRAAPGREHLESPLVQVQFWRVILDEVQMVNSGVSNAAKVARIIPRVHAWGVTGTPVKKDMTDLQGILIFLRMEPFASWNKVWSQLLASPNDFEGLFSSLSIRHTSSMLEDDISIPAQRRILLSIPFTPIEENNYQHLYNDMLNDCKDYELEHKGMPIDSSLLSTWLVRLRQACCHARIGMGNRKALGGGPLRTIEDVFDAMYEQAATSLLSDQRRYFTLFLERGQLLEKKHKSAEALELWIEAMNGVLPIVEDLRKEEAEALALKESREKERQATREARFKQREKDRLLRLGTDPDMTVTSTPFSESDFNEEDEDMIDDSDIKLRRLRLRSWVELLHRCYFFVASGHFQMYHEPGDDGANDDKRELSDEEKKHQELEKKYYDLAELLRRELLTEPTQKVEVLVEKLKSRAVVQQFVTLDDATIDDKKMAVGIESRNLLDAINGLGQALNRQADLIDNWREEIIKLLTKGLLDKDADPDGEEYGESLDAQEFAFSYLEVLQQVLSDRTEAITGTSDPTIMEKVAVLDDAKSDFQKDLEKARNDCRPIQSVPGSNNFEYSMAGYMSEIRTLPSTLTGPRGSIEVYLLMKMKPMVTKIYNEQRKELKMLTKEVSFLSDLYNARVEYYRQLQEISDNVVAVEVDDKDISRLLKKKEKEGTAIKKVINQQLGRRNYLSSLRSVKQSVQSKVDEKDATGADEDIDRLCVICQSTFIIGALTVCGHQFCRECLQEWWKLHKTCPVCKHVLGPDQVYNFTYRRTDVEMTHLVEEDEEEDSNANSNGIYSLAAKKNVSEIKSMPLSSNYGSKIDFIVQHLLWLRHLDKTTQVVIFSQWTEMLDLLKSALDDHYIQYASVNSRMDEFKKNPEIACFLLHAKAES